MKILFQGDSITDAGRNREDYHDLGAGYPKYAVEKIKLTHKDEDIEFINLGNSGNQTKDLLARLDTDIINIQPDIVSILLGINDIWHTAEGWETAVSDEQFEERYRTILTAIKEKTHAKIMILEPFLIPAGDKDGFEPFVAAKQKIVRKLAREFADVYVPLEGLLHSQIIRSQRAPSDFAPDSVHPTEYCAEFIGNVYAQYIEELL